MGDLVRQSLGAGGRLEVGRGRFFRLVKCAYAVDIQIRFPNEIKRVAGIEAGYAFGPLSDREYLGVVVTTATAQSVEVFNGEESEAYDRTVTVTQIAAAGAMVDSLFNLTAGQDVNALAPNTSRRRVLVKVDPDANAAARVRVSAVTAGNGPLLKPGDVLEVFTTGTVWLKNTSAVSAALSLIEELNS